MSDQENQEVKPKTAKQVALWLQRGRMHLARAQKPETRNQKSETASETATVNRTVFVQPPTANLQPPSKGQVAAFLWMPQVHLSLQAFTFPLALLVQTFAQILVTVGLLPADHPARSYTGAKSYGIMQVLEEARRGLPPLRTLWGNGTRMLATRQYAIFTSTLGVLVTGGLTLLTMFTQVFFGLTQAFAQAPYNGAGDFSVAGDLGIGFINAIFDPTGNSVTSSGLGELFRIYSGAMLIFAGLILLWIIISAVAETARTGIPFGKQFNHVWAPIRLITALGLLIPLGSGLNSGQHMVIYLTQWGSEQANHMWTTFADKTAINGGSGGTNTPQGSGKNIPGALSSIPVTTDSFREASDKLFDIMLCQNIYNQLKSADMPAMQREQKILNSGSTVGVIKADGSKGEVNGSNYYTRQMSWDVPNQLNCGSANLTELKPDGGGNGVAGAIASGIMLGQQSAELAKFVMSANGLASQVASAAINSTNSQHPDYGKFNMNMLDFYGNYQTIKDTYATFARQ